MTIKIYIDWEDQLVSFNLENEIKERITALYLDREELEEEFYDFIDDMNVSLGTVLQMLFFENSFQDLKIKFWKWMKNRIAIRVIEDFEEIEVEI